MEVVGSLAVGGALLVAFVLWEMRTTTPLMPLRLFRNRSFSVANIVGVTFSFGIYGAVFILIQFLQVVRGNSPLEAGLMTMPWTIAPMIVAPLTGLIAGRIGTRIPIVTGLALQSIAMLWLALTMSTTEPYSEMVVPFLLAGIGMGLVFAPSSTAVLAGMAPADHAKASGTNATLREIGVALGVAVLTAVFTGAGGTLTPDGYVDAAVPAVLVASAVLAGAMVVALFLPSGAMRPRGTMTDDDAIEREAAEAVPVASA
jgi:MFS family permease